MQPSCIYALCASQLEQLSAMIRVMTICYIALAIFGCSNPKQNTVFANGYSRNKFDTIQVGDSASTVFNILGKPLFIQKGSISNEGRSTCSETDQVNSFIPADLDSWYVLSYSAQLDGRKDFERNSIKIERGVVTSVLCELVDE